MFQVDGLLRWEGMELWSWEPMLDAEKAWSGIMEQMDNINTKQVLVHIGITHAISYGREQDSGQVK